MDAAREIFYLGEGVEGSSGAGGEGEKQEGGGSRSEGGGGEGVRECSAGGEGYWPRWAHEVVCVGESLCASAPAHLRCQYLYFCTSNRSKLST
jgi:hypothetical protein